MLFLILLTIILVGGGVFGYTAETLETLFILLLITLSYYAICHVTTAFVLDAKTNAINSFMNILQVLLK